MRLLSLFFLSILLGLPQLQSQNMELEMSFGTHLSRVSYSHTSEVENNDNTFHSNGNSNYTISISSPFKGNSWYLRTEIGFIKTNSLLNYSFTFNNGIIEERRSLITNLSNQKIQLSILPEYRIALKKYSIKIYAGLIYTSDLTNTFITTNQDFLTVSYPFGARIGLSPQVKIGDYLSINGSLVFTRLGNSQLQGTFSPQINYSQFGINLGIVYVLFRNNSSK